MVSEQEVSFTPRLHRFSFAPFKSEHPHYDIHFITHIVLTHPTASRQILSGAIFTLYTHHSLYLTAICRANGRI